MRKSHIRKKPINVSSSSSSSTSLVPTKNRVRSNANLKAAVQRIDSPAVSTRSQKKSIVEDIEQVDCIQNQSKDVEEGAKKYMF